MKREIRLASEIGFCFGVKNALNAVRQYAQNHSTIVTWGDIVHNNLVTDSLKELGVRVVTDMDNIGADTVIIPSHGVSPEIIQEFNDRNITIVDTTCPFVKRAQKAAASYGKKGFFTIVYGDKNHAEVKGILGWAGENALATKDIDEIKKMPTLPLKIGLISQTTQKPSEFIQFCKDVLDLAFAKDSRIYITDTICHDIRKRQQGAVEIAQWADLVVVIGSPHSANTRNLYELCSAYTHAVQVESAKDLSAKTLGDYQKIGIAAGASTDDQAISGVFEKVQNL